MAVFTIPFTTPSDYTYNSSKIGVSGGKALLLEDLTEVNARYHMNEASGSNVLDSSGKERNGLAIGSPTWGTGKLSNCLIFNGATQYVNCGQAGNFERDQPFSVELWFKTSLDSRIPIGKQVRSDPNGRGWFIDLNSVGKVEFFLISDLVSGNRAAVQTNDSGYDDNVFHHVIVTYDGSSDASGIKIYLDGLFKTLNAPLNNLTDTILNSSDMTIGSTDSNFNPAVCWDGSIDEVVLYSRELTLSEVLYRYNSGAGRENTYFYSDKPSIYKTLGDTGQVSQWSGFSVTEGTVEGSLAYQLSDNGVDWYYWDGGTWSLVGVDTYNTASVINNNITSFSATEGSIYVKVFFISDSTQIVEIDEIQVIYIENLNPSVSAGTDKNCFDNQYLAIFSDCTFSDPDGTIDTAYYKVDGEIDVWTEIPQGGYASLLEAVQSFQYKFTNIGAINVRLKVEDNLGGYSEDSLTVTVSKYTKTINVKDVADDSHLFNVEFDSGDGSGVVLKNSPFSYSWAYGNFNLVIGKNLYYDKTVSLTVEDQNELTIYLQATSLLSEIKASVGLKTESDTLLIMCWLQQGGEVISTSDSCTVKLYNENNILKYSSTSNEQNNGVFSFTETPSGLDDEGVYLLQVLISVNGVLFYSVVAVGYMERKLMSYKTSVQHLQDIYDESLGKWVLDPDSKTLTLYRLDGSLLKVMDLIDTTRTLPSFIERSPR